MKIVLLFIMALVILFSLFQIYVMLFNKTETQKYTVEKIINNIEIRHYPSVTLATISSSAKTYKVLANSGFRKLAGFIFGGNASNVRIAMTSPVHLDINESQSSMSFVMPSGYTKENLPKPNDTEVTFQSTSDEYVAVIQFGGYASDKAIQTYSKQLEEELSKVAIPFYGHFRLLGYNPPYQLFGRRNEIIVSVNWDTTLLK